jgi:hypothetical protein
MRSTYVVKELVSVGAGKKAFCVHYEYGFFSTYEAANECAAASKNTSCFPQNEVRVAVMDAFVSGFSQGCVAAELLEGSTLRRNKKDPSV